ncbi:MAG TPA: hypothetical protein VFB35_02610 [Gaiellaceae bacterium]|nr:hypothetical protein [Gaiellaceae bacterium]
MALTRRQLLAGGVVGGAVASGGLYALVDQLSRRPRRPAAGPLPPEQHVLHGQHVVTDNGVEVLVPPLHHEVVTARVRVEGPVKELKGAQAELEYLLISIERQFQPTPAGLGVTVAWGLPYFRRLVPHLAEREIPVDRRASTSRNRPVKVLLDARRFPSDPEDTVLEANDVAILLRSDSLEHIALAHKALFTDSDLFEVRSIRRGFAGGGFAGGQSLPKRLATAAGVPGADLIPDQAELFLGFTSTQKAGLGPPKIANVEELGFSDGGYFAGGTHLALSHIAEDLEAWYVNFAHGERVATTFRPGLRVSERTLTVPQGPDDVIGVRGVERDFRRDGQIGHSSSLQTVSRLRTTAVGRSGTIYGPGTAIPQRADFNTLDNPFAWSADPERDGMGDGPAAGVHFVVFNPSSDDFDRMRLAMDGVLPDGARLPFAPRDRGQGFNSILRTTHRQNFLVPPRDHRSFPLVELLV